MNLTTKQMQVRRLARRLRWLVTLALAGCALIWMLFSGALWTGRGASPAPDGGAGQVPGIGLRLADAGGLAEHPVALWLYMSLTLAIVGYGLYRLRALLLGYEAGELFSRSAADHLSAFALCMVIRELVDLVAPLMAGIGHFTIDSGSLRLLLVGTVFWLLSRVLAAAYALADDHGRII